MLAMGPSAYPADTVLDIFTYGGAPGTNNGQYAWEWWYKWQVTDNISITPAIYYLSAPLGQLQRGGGLEDGVRTSSDTFNNFGGLVKTTFKF